MALPKPKTKPWYETVQGILAALTALVVALTGLFTLLLPALRSHAESSDHRFAVLLRADKELALRIGSISAEPRLGRLTIQVYEHGFLLWSEPDDQFFLCDNAENRWRRVKPVDLSKPDFERLRAEVEPAAKALLDTWASGFVRIWSVASTRKELGLPLLPAYELPYPVYQRFSTGHLLRDLPFWETVPAVYKVEAGSPTRILILAGSESGTWSFRS